MWNWLRKLFKPLLRVFWSFLKAIFTGAVEILLAQLRELAIQVVMGIAEDPSILTDENKRKMAFKRLKEKAKKRGIETRDSILNLALELAVTYCKQKKLI